ncbi:MAG: hypothetical protein AAFR47_00345 [Pseudomonadota bacterium]
MLRALAILVALSAAPLPAEAHLSAGEKRQTLILWTDANGTLTGYLRVPAPLLFGDTIAEARASRMPLASPFLRTEARGVYALRVPDTAQDRFRTRLSRALSWRQDGRVLVPDVTAWRILPDARVSPPATRAAAQAELVEGQGAALVEFGHAYVAFLFELRDAAPLRAMSVQAGLPPLEALPPEIRVTMRLKDLRGPAMIRTFEGQLTEPVFLPPVPAAETFRGAMLALLAAILLLLAVGVVARRPARSAA